MFNQKGFTLIELLVVVLIIGILAAITVPQYQYAVLKSEYHTLMNMTKAVKDAQEVFFLANGKYATHFSELDISVPDNAIIEDFQLKASSGKFVSREAMVFNEGKNIISLDNDQVHGLMFRNNDYYMDYNLRLDNKNMWNGARAICVSWAEAGNIGQKLCKNLSNAPESCSANNIGRYSCLMFF